MTTAVGTRKTYESPALNNVLTFLAGESMVKMTNSVIRNVLVPLAAILVFLLLWTAGAKQVQTSLGELPGPAKVWEQSVALYEEHNAERTKESDFNERMEKRVEKAIADGELDKIPHFLTDRWLADTTMFGTAAQVREQVEAWYDTGVKTPIIVPSSAAGNQLKAAEEVFAAFQ